MNTKHTEAGQAMQAADRKMIADLIRRSRERSRAENPRAAAMPLPMGRRCSNCNDPKPAGEVRPRVGCGDDPLCDRCHVAAIEHGKPRAVDEAERDARGAA